MWTSAGQGDGSPIPFYERYGFVRTGEVVFDDEVLLRLELTESSGRLWRTRRDSCSLVYRTTPVLYEEVESCRTERTSTSFCGY